MAYKCEVESAKRSVDVDGIVDVDTGRDAKANSLGCDRRRGVFKRRWKWKWNESRKEEVDGCKQQRGSTCDYQIWKVLLQSGTVAVALVSGGVQLLRITNHHHISIYSLVLCIALGNVT